MEENEKQAVWMLENFPELILTAQVSLSKLILTAQVNLSKLIPTTR